MTTCAPRTRSWRHPVVAATLLFAAHAPSRAAIVPDAAVMRFDEIGTYTLGFQYRGKAEQRMPPGWTGFFEENTGIACMPMGRQNGRDAFLIHCPWRGGTGVTFQRFDVRLPRAPRVTLAGATAMRSDIVGKSDGSTFRVYVNGKAVLDEHRTDDPWRAFSADLTRYAGTTVAIRFETDPGPRNDPSFDYSLWADRELRIAGFHPTTTRHLAPAPLDLRAITSRRIGGVVPQSGFRGTRRVSVSGDTATLAYFGADGSLVYRWRLPSGPDDPPFGHLSLRAHMRHDPPVEVPLARAARLVWRTPARAAEAARWVGTGGTLAMARAYRLPDGVATLRVSARLQGKSLVLDVSCDRPVLGGLEAGGWGPVMRRRNVPVPYYSGQVAYLPRENLFSNAYLDWTASSASSHDGVRAVYAPLTDGRRNRLRERVVFSAAWHLAEVLPNVPNPPSPYRREMGRRLVLDIWGGRYTDIARGFANLASYGVRDCYSIIHVWQRSGYDNALPAHVPAAADLGGEDGMRTLVRTGKQFGHRVALHENYVDYYPNYEGFREADIARESDGKRVPAWYNPGTKVQSFGVKPTAMLRLAATQSPEAHQRYGTNASYLDVHSAVPPWFHVDADATQPGAGRFSTVWNAHRDLWAYERQTHGGPVTGEGNNHWYWSGLLDGAEAQFGSGWPGNQGLHAPLMVDFDLLKVHPLQVNLGMGYYERWWDRPQWGSVPPMVVLDQYRMQEVAYGHAAFLAAATWNVTPLAWLENHLLTPVTARYATTTPADIRYQVGGRWVDPTAAAKAADWNRVRVRYANGLVVTANNAPAPLRAGGLTLPRFGWLAQGAGVIAYTALRQGALVDYAETASSVFANARDARDWNISGLCRIRPEVAALRPTGPRRFEITYRWHVGERLPESHLCFVHFSALKPGYDPYDWAIRFQNDHWPAAPTNTWQPGTSVLDGPHAVTVPVDLADGDFAVCVGLCDAGGGARVPIEGVDEGHGRVVLGVVRVRGDAITFDQERRTGADRTAIYRQHTNLHPRVVDFGPVRTDGSVLVRREGTDWVLRALPRERPFTVWLKAARFGRPARVSCVGGTRPGVVPAARGAWWRLPLSGATEYRWRAAR